MKWKSNLITLGLVAFAILNLNVTTTLAQGTAFTYQGRLNDGTNLAGGIYDLRLGLFNRLTAGTQQGDWFTNAATLVTNGMFTVVVDFGNRFPGSDEARWLDIAVRTNGGSSFTPLAPRQLITATPYAITAGNAVAVSPSQNFTGANTFNGSIALLDPASSITFPATSGANSPMMYMFASGSANSDRMVIAHSPSYLNWGLQYQDFGDKFNFLSGGTPVLTVDLNTRKVGIGTSAPTTALQVAGTVAATSFSGDGSGLTGLNVSQGFWRTNGNVGANPANGAYLGTADNLPLEFKVNGSRALRLEPNAGDAPNVVGGSSVNYVTPGVVGAVIAGGGAGNFFATGTSYTNSVAVIFGSIGGGANNTIQAYASYSIIGGGLDNMVTAGAYQSTIGGGVANTIQNSLSAIGGGGNNTIKPNASGSTIGGGQQNTVQTNAQISTIGGGIFNSIQNNAFYSTISGGYNNSIQANLSYATIAGGGVNLIQTNASGSTINGGAMNTIQTNAAYSFIGGGNYNTVQNDSSYCTIDGGAFNFIGTNAPYSSIGGGVGNFIQPNTVYATISGGYANAASGNLATVAGGTFNIASGAAAYAVGSNVLASGYGSTAMGVLAQAIHPGSFVWSDSSSITPFASTAANQFLLRASGGVGIGTTNPLVQLMVNGNTRVDAQTGVAYSEGLVINCPSNMTVSGGYGGIGFHNASRGAPLTSASVKWGIYFDYVAEGATIGAGGLAFIQNNVSTRLFLGANGNVGIGNTSPNNLLVVGSAGSPAYCNGTTWVNGSDRNSKEAFAAVNPRSVLEKVAALSISEWKYKVDGQGTRHIGPVAQDFHAAFGLNGTDDKHIATVDEEGVALAAIQGLNEKLEEQNAKLQTRLERLERLLDQKLQR
jgi:hypothetical protein